MKDKKIPKTFFESVVLDPCPYPYFLLNVTPNGWLNKVAPNQTNALPQLPQLAWNPSPCFPTQYKTSQSVQGLVVEKQK